MVSVKPQVASHKGQILRAVRVSAIPGFSTPPQQRGNPGFKTAIVVWVLLMVPHVNGTRGAVCLDD
jgi:hypothetical protein